MKISDFVKTFSKNAGRYKWYLRDGRLRAETNRKDDDCNGEECPLTVVYRSIGGDGVGKGLSMSLFPHTIGEKLGLKKSVVVRIMRASDKDNGLTSKELELRKSFVGVCTPSKKNLPIAKKKEVGKKDDVFKSEYFGGRKLKLAGEKKEIGGDSLRKARRVVKGGKV